MAFETPAAETAATDEAGGATAASAEYDLFNNDARLRAIKTLADTLAPVEQKKAILYFSSGMARSGSDNQVELRTAISAAVRANVSLYPVDTRGLQAVVPGGDATRASAFGTGAFSGRGVRGQFDQLQASQETLQTLASDTGGSAFVDSNNFGEAFTQVIRDTSAYYLLGYSSTNDDEGRPLPPHQRAREDARPARRTPRRLLRRARLRAHGPSGSRARAAGTAGLARVVNRHPRVPVRRLVPPRRRSLLRAAVGGDSGRRGWRRRDDQRDRRARHRARRAGAPGGAHPPDAQAGDGRQPKQVLYQSGLSLPPGRFSAKVVVRENANGTVGSFETGVFVPDLRRAPLKVSSVTLSTQLRPVEGRLRTDNPLVRDGVEILPSLSHVVDRAQKMYFYYEVYEPESPPNGTSTVKTSLAFYRGAVKVFETPLVERTGLDAADRRAAIFQFEVPASGFQPGLYTCQVNIIDDVAGRFLFPRLAVYVR